jgi:hypothetical protein
MGGSGLSGCTRKWIGLRTEPPLAGGSFPSRATYRRATLKASLRSVRSPGGYRGVNTQGVRRAFVGDRRSFVGAFEGHIEAVEAV